MAATLLKTPRQFAPLKESGDNTAERVPRLRGVVFDVDGTLWCVATTCLQPQLSPEFGDSVCVLLQPTNSLEDFIEMLQFLYITGFQRLHLSTYS